MTSQNPDSQVNDLPAVGHRSGLLFSLLCRWERTESTWVSTGCFKHAQVDFHIVCSQTWNIFQKKISGSWKDWFTPWKRFKRVAQQHIGHCVYNGSMSATSQNYLSPRCGFVSSVRCLTGSVSWGGWRHRPALPKTIISELIAGLGEVIQMRFT